MAPDLAEIVDAWPELPEAIKAGILAMVKACALLSTPSPSGSRPGRGWRREFAPDLFLCPMFGIEPGVIPRRMAVPMGAPNTHAPRPT